MLPEFGREVPLAEIWGSDAREFETSTLISQSINQVQLMRIGVESNPELLVKRQVGLGQAFIPEMSTKV